MIFSKKAQQLAVQSSLCLLLSACQSYEPFTEEEVFRGAYERNFKRTFGWIDKHQCWDFSACSSSSDSSLHPTRTDASPGFYELFADPKTYYEVDEAFLTQIIEKNKDNERGRNFALLVDPDDWFEIIPVFMKNFNDGKFEWNLQAFVDQDMIGSTNAYGWYMGSNVGVKTRDGKYYAINYNHPIDVCGFRAMPICQYRNEDRRQKLMYFNLYIKSIKSGFSQYASYNSQQSSLNHQMKVLDVPHPANIDAQYETLFIACEAANFDPNVTFTLNDGKRFQNLVFMVVGPKLPKVVYPEVGQDELSFDKSVSSKRYMIEDLGSTSDFDFNDIVVDVTQQEKVTLELSQERASASKPIKTTISPKSSGEIRTEATVQHLCGTKPFQLTVGDYAFGRVTDPTNLEQTIAQLKHQEVDNPKEFEAPEVVEGCDPKVTAIIPDWNPAVNKVSVTVWRRAENSLSEGGWTVNFPADGEVPYIMALPISQQWTMEGQRFVDWKKYVLRTDDEQK